MKREIIAALLDRLIPILVSIVSGYVLFLVRKYVHNDAVLKALQVLGEIIKASVGNASQRVVADLKDPNKPGSWDKVAAEAVKSTVIEDIKTIGKPPIDVLVKHGGFTPQQVDALVDRGVETAVREEAVRASNPPAAPTIVVAPVVEKKDTPE